MKMTLSKFRNLLFAGAAVLISGSASSAELTTSSFSSNQSYKNELQHAIDRGLEWLQANQNSNGWWSTADQPAVTGEVLMAFKGDPKQRYSKSEPSWMAKSYQFIMDSAKPDGGIHRTNLVTYNTAISMMALIAANKAEYNPTILKAREYLISLQTDMGEKGKVDSPFDGGIGYGSHYDHSDMGNTLQALEAIYYSKALTARDSKLSEAKDLNWGAAISFLQNCQNLPSVNTNNWVSDQEKDKGGFVYYPGNSMAGGTTNLATGKIALRSYGSISYGGMLSYAYADLKKEDPRVSAVYQWLQNNYTVDENPEMGAQGLYYYYNTMSKALTVYGIDEIPLARGGKAAWKKDLSMKLLNLQQKDGSWLNTNARWWEKDGALVTAYSVMTLERVYATLK